MYHVQCLLLFAWIQHVPAVYGHYVFPWWADLIGWMMSFVVAACVPVYAIYALCSLQSGSFLQVRLHSEADVYRYSHGNFVGIGKDMV